MKPSIASLVLVLALGSAAAVSGADTPVFTPPTVGERLALARQAIAERQWKKAVDQLNRAVRDEPRNADIHNLLGYSYRKQAKPDLARAFVHYRKAIEIDPRHKGAHEYIGEAYLMDNKPQEAEKHLATLQQLCGNTSCEEYADLAKAIADHKARH